MTEEPKDGDEVFQDDSATENLDLSTLAVGNRFTISGDNETCEVQVIECLRGGPVVVMFSENTGRRKIAQIIGTIPFTSSSLLVRELLIGIIGIGDQVGYMVYIPSDEEDNANRTEMMHVDSYELQV